MIRAVAVAVQHAVAVGRRAVAEQQHAVVAVEPHVEAVRHAVVTRAAEVARQ